MALGIAAVDVVYNFAGVSEIVAEDGVHNPAAAVGAVWYYSDSGVHNFHLTSIFLQWPCQAELQSVIKNLILSIFGKCD